MMDDDMLMSEQTPSIQQGSPNGQYQYDPNTGLPIITPTRKMLSVPSFFTSPQ
jgi:hypothetical protein